MWQYDPGRWQKGQRCQLIYSLPQFCTEALTLKESWMKPKVDQSLRPEPVSAFSGMEILWHSLPVISPCLKCSETPNPHDNLMSLKKGADEEERPPGSQADWVWILARPLPSCFRFLCHREDSDSYLSGLLGHVKYEHSAQHIIGVLKMISLSTTLKVHPFLCLIRDGWSHVFPILQASSLMGRPKKVRNQWDERIYHTLHLCSTKQALAKTSPPSFFRTRKCFRPCHPALSNISTHCIFI